MHLMVHSRAFNNYYRVLVLHCFVGIIRGEEGKGINPNESNSSKRLAPEGIGQIKDTMIYI